MPSRFNTGKCELTDWKQELGNQIRESRKDLSWTQQELRERAKLHVNSISRYETGEAAPELDVLLRLASLLEREDFKIGDYEITIRKSVQDGNVAPSLKQLRLRFGNEYVFDDGEALMRIQPGKSGLVIIPGKRTA